MTNVQVGSPRAGIFRIRKAVTCSPGHLGHPGPGTGLSMRSCLIHEPAQGPEILLGGDRLHPSAEGSGEPSERFARTRKCSDVESDGAVARDGDDERLFALLRMAWQCSVCKAKPPWFIDHRDDPTRCGDRTQAGPQGDDDRRPYLQRGVCREHPDAPDPVCLPGAEAFNGPGQDVGASADDGFLIDKVVALGEFVREGCPILGVRRIGGLRGGQLPCHRRGATRADDAHGSSQTLEDLASTLQAGVPPGRR